MVARNPSFLTPDPKIAAADPASRFDYHDPLLESLQAVCQEVTGNPEKAAELLISVGLMRRLPDGSLEEVHDVRDSPLADG